MTDARPIRLAVVTGGHGYDVPNVYKLSRSPQGVDATIQHIDDVSFPPEAVLVFNDPGKSSHGPRPTGKRRLTRYPGEGDVSWN